MKPGVLNPVLLIGVDVKGATLRRARGQNLQNVATDHLHLIVLIATQAKLNKMSRYKLLTF